MSKNKRKMGLSKKLLIADYTITLALLIVFFIFACINGTYVINTIDKLIETGVDVSMASISPPFDLDIFGVLLATWIIQLGVSSGAYYVLIKSERKIELPIKLLDDLPDNIKDDIDITQIITTVLSCTNN